MHPNHPQRRILAAYLAVVCTAALGVATGGDVARADPRDDARRVDRAVDRAAAVLEDATARARAAATQLAAAMSALPGARRRVGETRGRVIAAQVLANSARRRADAAQARYLIFEARYNKVQQQVEKARQRVDTVVAATYKGSQFAAINIIAAATGPQDVMDRIGYVDQVMDSQQADVDEYLAARRRARTAQDRAGAAKRVAEQAEQDAVATLDAARAARDDALRARSAVVALAASRRRALRIAESEREAVLDRYRELKAEEARISASLRAWDRHQGDGSLSSFGGGSTLMTPVRGWKSSDFGMRLNPVYGVWRLHAGTDFAASGGTPIHAAAEGQVVNAGWSGGYGNYTCISHGRYRGEGLSTCYGHQSAILVGSGQNVSRGQVIGRVGSTGASTGNHLHFEVRLNGDPRDPVGFLPSCLC